MMKFDLQIGYRNFAGSCKQRRAMKCTVSGRLSVEEDDL